MKPRTLYRAVVSAILLAGTAVAYYPVQSRGVVLAVYQKFNAPDPEKQPDGGYLSNTRFDSTATSLDPQTTDGRITGDIARGWLDDSFWADTEATYSIDPSGGRDGQSCQKIDVKRVRRGDCQMAQLRWLRAGRYRAAIWIKADTRRSVTLSLVQSMGGPPYPVEVKRSFSVGPEWRQISIDADLPFDDETMFMIRMPEVGRYRLDDALLTSN